ncbi:hypothetical protein GOP47_0017469 [Adiantum capillus-veneris]|uniref:Uncharacterized protein n=1 Tax=Adiantum capillus-veneris TaxID=13818 RepID=A0A9D4ZBT1_ADICA|nr:hypothetical protein GOP47_0017469 [Adiantum capillus-veneris]
MARPLPFNKHKVVSLGNESVGNTSIITSFVYEKFDNSYEGTIGIDFLSKSIHLENGQIFRLQIWDTAGQERFRSLIPSYMRDSSLAVVVLSFDSTVKWIQEVRKERGEDVHIILVGNMVDLVNKRDVSIEEGSERARELCVSFIETSAKEGFNIKSLFAKIMAIVLASIHDDTAVTTLNSSLVDVVESMLANEGGKGFVCAGLIKCVNVEISHYDQWPHGARRLEMLFRNPGSAL